jgi:hypothetical protein
MRGLVRTWIWVGSGLGDETFSPKTLEFILSKTLRTQPTEQSLMGQLFHHGWRAVVLVLPLGVCGCASALEGRGLGGDL